MKIRFIFVLLFLTIDGSITLVSCSSGSDEPRGNVCEEFPNLDACLYSSSGYKGNSSSSSGDNCGNNNSNPIDISVTKAIKIKYNNGGAPTITKPNEVLTNGTNGENVVITLPDSAYNLVLSGTTTNGSLKIYGDFRKGLYLNGVSITNTNGPAINIQDGKRADVNLVSCTDNFLSDGGAYPYSSTPGEEQAKGTLFSEGKLYFTGGNGTLEVRGKANHAIAVDNDFEIRNGTITVSEAKNDGIHANDKIEVKGGTLVITSIGDAIQSEEPSGSIEITGGRITATTSGVKSHGISSEGPATIGGTANVQIEVKGDGSKGIRSRSYTEFLGGETIIRAKGTTSSDASTATGVKTEENLYIEGGILKIYSTGNGSKGISVDRDAFITAGNVHIEAHDDGIKVNRNLTITSGSTVYVKSSTTTAIDVDGDETGTNGSNVTKVDGGL